MAPAIDAYAVKAARIAYLAGFGFHVAPDALFAFAGH
jgi:hypothetical protein